MKNVAAAHDFVDKHMAASSAKSAQLGKPVTCRGSGCFGCCKEPVYAEAREVAHLIEALDDMRQIEKVVFLAKLRAWWTEFQRSGLHELPGPDEAVGLNAAMRYRMANLYCPLLVDGKCSVYSHRPLACRMHAAVGDPKDCTDEGNRPDQLYLSTRERPEIERDALVLVIANEKAPVRLIFDHLGVILVRAFFDRDAQTRATVGMEITE